MLDSLEALPRLAHDPRSARIGVVSTYPPTRCGIGRFAASLVTALAETERMLDLHVVRLVHDQGQRLPGREVVMEIDPKSRVAIGSATRHLNHLDAVIVQHEFGIYGPDDGRAVIDLVTAVEVPTIVVLHTVLPDPSVRQKQIVESLAENAKVVVLCHSAANLLKDRYSVHPGAVEVIHHGAHWSPQPIKHPPRRQVITWGLLGPGKGLERSIRAIARLRDVDPPVEYRIVGRTHPEVAARHGYGYRHQLQELVRELHVSESVEFIDRYVSDAELFDLVRRSDIVVVPYDNSDQVSSGVITEAVGMGRPVVATRFPYSEEMLGSGAGIVVDHDVEALSDAIRVLTDDAVAYRKAANGARELSRQFAWPQVAAQYLRLIRTMVPASATA